MAHLQGMDAEKKRHQVLELAQIEGLKAGVLAGVASTAAVAAGTKFSSWFRRSTSVSAKTAIAVSPFFLCYFLRTELVMHRANHDPAAYGLVGKESSADSDTHTAQRTLSVPERAANWLYLNPFKMIAGMGIPAVGGILYSMRNETNLKLSQKLMHTRVYGQMTVVTMLLTTMMFRETMRRNGGVFVASEADGADEAKDLE